MKMLTSDPCNSSRTQTAAASLTYFNQGHIKQLRIPVWGSLLLFWACCFPRSVHAQSATDYLYSGRLSNGEAAVIKSLAADEDPNERFGLGLIQFMRAMETLVQDLNRHGFLTERTFGSLMPGELREIFPDSRKPETFSNEVFRTMVKNWIAGLERADKTLSLVGEGEVKLRLKPSQVKFDPSGTGKRVSARELLRLMFGGVAGMDPTWDSGVERFEGLKLALDRGDVHWLRGYLNLQMAFGECLLALDFSTVIEVSAHRLFEKVDTPHDWLLDENRILMNDDLMNSIPAIVMAAADVIAGSSEMLHLDVIEPERFQKAANHVVKSITLSREMWKEILAETDNDQEWIPNPRQDGAIGVNVDRRMITTWLSTLDELELILKGKRLIPFWRFAFARNWKKMPGINLKKAIDQPPEELSIILWLQGTAVTPYLEKGRFTDLSDEAFLQQIDRAFGYNYFGGFALWFN